MSIMEEQINNEVALANIPAQSPPQTQPVSDTVERMECPYCHKMIATSGRTSHFRSMHPEKTDWRKRPFKGRSTQGNKNSVKKSTPTKEIAPKVDPSPAVVVEPVNAQKIIDSALKALYGTYIPTRDSAMVYEWSKATHAFIAKVVHGITQ